ncbi:MAG: acyl-CoA thioesterase [Rhodobacteraceae bacterium]|nr:acyl-CoA thioesterase [Paracoccaceae bacterium]
MYPFIRMVYHSFKYRKAPALPVEGVHVSRHICWPVDLDLWRELNNGRTLTLYDLGRIQLARRIGLVSALRANGWGMTMAGVTARYRRRVVMFDHFEMRSKAIGHDGRFFYLQQSMWKGDDALSSVVYRVAVVGKNGIVPTQDVVSAMGVAGWNPDMPLWVMDWIKAENGRIWPPDT